MYPSIINCFTVVLILNLLPGNGAYEWRLFDFKNDPLPRGAILSGVDVNGDDVYVARIYRNGDILPGNAIPSKNILYTSYGGEVITWGVCELLVKDRLVWQSTSKGSVPEGAVEAGKTKDGETLYYGRASCNGYMTPGKVHPSHGQLYYSFNGNEYHTEEYEILVEKN